MSWSAQEWQISKSMFSKKSVLMAPPSLPEQVDRLAKDENDETCHGKQWNWNLAIRNMKIMKQREGSHIPTSHLAASGTSSRTLARQVALGSAVVTVSRVVMISLWPWISAPNCSLAMCLVENLECLDYFPFSSTFNIPISYNFQTFHPGQVFVDFVDAHRCACRCSFCFSVVPALLLETPLLFAAVDPPRPARLWLMWLAHFGFSSRSMPHLGSWYRVSRVGNATPFASQTFPCPFQVILSQMCQGLWLRKQETRHEIANTQMTNIYQSTTTKVHHANVPTSRCKDSLQLVLGWHGGHKVPEMPRTSAYASQARAEVDVWMCESLWKSFEACIWRWHAAAVNQGSLFGLPGEASLELRS